MSNRRAANRIRGPHSALTDFLAANNISAQQIRDSYQQRVTRTEQAQASGSGSSAENAGDEDESEVKDEAQLEEEIDAIVNAATERSRKRKREEEKSAKAKAKAGKDKKAAKKKHGSDDEDYDDLLGESSYKKARKLPGQQEHCELCSKRFTVTPYSKTGPENGLVCTPCGKEMAKDAKQVERANKKPNAVKRRRKVESDRLDGIVTSGAKSLQQLCVEKIAKHHTDIEEFGDLPNGVTEKLSEIFSKQRILNNRTLNLFLRPDLNAVSVHDCAYLETEDYARIFAVAPHIEKLVLRNACQFKDETMDYMLEKAPGLRDVALHGANLVSDEGWIRFFEQRGPKLRSLKLQWLDASFDDDAVAAMLEHCQNIERLKLKRCRRVTADGVDAIAQLPKLQHLSLQLSAEIPIETLLDLITARGPQLRTLSLERFQDADDSFLEAVHDHCRSLSKLRLTENDCITDAALAALFTNWANPPLRFADFNSTRDIDNANPDGPADAPVGFGDAALAALMAHSGEALETLDLASCRHLSYAGLTAAFNGRKHYPALRELNLSFVAEAETTVLAGVFASCPALKKVVAFGCFHAKDVQVPSGLVMIGASRAQEAIEQFGDGGLPAFLATERAVEVGA